MPNKDEAVTKKKNNIKTESRAELAIYNNELSTNGQLWSGGNYVTQSKSQEQSRRIFNETICMNELQLHATRLQTGPFTQHTILWYTQFC